jgi:hypothetical protein
MIKFFYLLLLITSFSFSEMVEDEAEKTADCLILEDENSIVCKYIHPRTQEDKTVRVIWIDPAGEISRDRELTLLAGHGSIYDFRYISGRKKGIWTFKVIDEKDEITTTFELK